MYIYIYIYMYVCICACIYICTCYHYVLSLCNRYYYLHLVFKNNYYCNLFMLNHGGMFIYKLFCFFHSPFQHSMYFYFHIYCNTCTLWHVHICECWNKIIELNIELTFNTRYDMKNWPWKIFGCWCFTLWSNWLIKWWRPLCWNVSTTRTSWGCVCFCALSVLKTSGTVRGISYAKLSKQLINDISW